MTRTQVELDGKRTLVPSSGSKPQTLNVQPASRSWGLNLVYGFGAGPRGQNIGLQIASITFSYFTADHVSLSLQKAAILLVDIFKSPLGGRRSRRRRERRERRWEGRGGEWEQAPESRHVSRSEDEMLGKSEQMQSQAQ